MKQENLVVHYIGIEDLQENTYNPRLHTQKQITELKKSIKKFWLVDPILCNSYEDRKNIVIGWAFRLKVAKELWIEKVPVVYVNIKDIEKEKELNLRLNKNTWGWDIKLLEEYDVEILLDVGFDNSELSEIWDNLLEVENDSFQVQDVLEKIGKPKSKNGDIFELWKHRLVCGDSTKKETIKTLMWTDISSFIYCDPPYNIWLDYSAGISTKGKYKWWFQSDSKTIDEYKAFLDVTIKNIQAHTDENTHMFYWCDENYIGTLQELYKENNITPKRVCLWVKNNHNMTPQVAFNKVYEPCVYWVSGKPYINSDIKNFHEILNSEVTSWNRAHDDILDLFTIWLEKRKASQDYEHPTEKPPKLHERALRRCSKPWDIVVDMFWGSWSTLIACEQLKRKAYLSEIDPIFVDLICRRYEAYTGKKVKKIWNYIDNNNTWKK